FVIASGPMDFVSSAISTERLLSTPVRYDHYGRANVDPNAVVATWGRQSVRDISGPVNRLRKRNWRRNGTDGRAEQQPAFDVIHPRHEVLVRSSHDTIPRTPLRCSVRLTALRAWPRL